MKTIKTLFASALAALMLVAFSVPANAEHEDADDISVVLLTDDGDKAQVQAALMLHPDFREAYEAFREKRTPRFR